MSQREDVKEENTVPGKISTQGLQANQIQDKGRQAWDNTYSSQTNTEPDLMFWRSFSESLRWTRGKRPNRHASKRMIASAGVRTWPV